MERRAFLGVIAGGLLAAPLAGEASVRALSKAALRKLGQGWP
jgi:hypothetical protein